jgi:hypothetical protein
MLRRSGSGSNLFATNSAVIPYQANFMERSLETIKTEIKKAVDGHKGQQGQVYFRFLSLAYNAKHCDTSNQPPHAGPGLTCALHLIPTGYAAQGLQPVTFYYALNDHPTLGDVLDSINIDFATLFLAVRYPALQISGCEAPKHLDIISVAPPVVEVVNPGQQPQLAQHPLEVKGLRQCFNLEKGRFDVEKYLALVNPCRQAMVEEVRQNPAKFTGGKRVSLMVNNPVITWSQAETLITCPVFVSKKALLATHPQVEILGDEAATTAYRPGSSRK